MLIHTCLHMHTHTVIHTCMCAYHAFTHCTYTYSQTYILMNFHPHTPAHLYTHADTRPMHPHMPYVHIHTNTPRYSHLHSYTHTNTLMYISSHIHMLRLSYPCALLTLICTCANMDTRAYTTHRYSYTQVHICIHMHSHRLPFTLMHVHVQTCMHTCACTHKH